MPGLGWEPLRRIMIYVVSLFPVALAGCLFLSWGVSLAVPGLKLVTGSSSSWAGAAFLYIMGFVLLAWLLNKAKSIPERYAVWALIGLSVIIKLVLVMYAMKLPLHTDQALFHLFVREMSDHRLQGETLSALSRIYDYPVWAGRVLPVHYWVRCLAPDQDILWIRLLNVGLSTAILFVTYGFACRLLPEGCRKWAVFLLMALPFQSFVATDFSHHLFSSFYFLLFMWCVWEMVFADPQPLRRLALSVLTGICLLLMMWQRGVHFIALGVMGLMLLWAGVSGIGWKRWGILVISMGVIPLTLSLPLAVRYDQWLNSHDTYQLNSILPAFMARGWCPESDGEYCGRYEQLDRVTPWPEKKSAMIRLVLSQIRYNPTTVCVRFPVIKTAKLFLVGYASNFEEGLSRSMPSVLPWARGIRLAATPIFLGLAILGCLGLAVRPGVQSRWLPILLAPLLTWGAYVFLGETSPRYSIFCQPFLGLLGAWGLAKFTTHGRKALVFPRGAWYSIAIRGGIVLGAIILALGVLVLAVRLIPAHRLYADLRQGWTADDGAESHAIHAGEFQPFEVGICLLPGPSFTHVDWALPFQSPDVDKMSLYVLDVQGDTRLGRLSIAASEEVLWTRELAEFSEPQYVELELPPLTEKLTFTLEKLSEIVPSNGCVQLGYISFMEKGESE